jgi:hypothetical protein
VEQNIYRSFVIQQNRLIPCQAPSGIVEKLMNVLPLLKGQQ